MRLSVIKKLLLSSAAFLAVLHPVNSLSADPDELRQKLDQLQRSLEGAAPAEPLEELEKKLQVLKELLKGEGLTEDERRGLEERLKMLKGQLIPQEKPLIVIEEAATAPEENKFFIEGRYWLAYTEGGDKDVAALYNIDTKSISNSLAASLDPTSAFIVSAGYKHAAGGTTTLRLWHLDTRGSITRNATSTIGISGTEASNYYYQKYPWGTGTFAVKGVDRVDADINLKSTNADVYYTTPIGKGANKELGVALGLKYAQVDSDYEITYFSSSPLYYNIKSNAENTLLGPLFGIYGKGSIFNKLSFTGFFDVAIAWDHVRAWRSEYDYTVTPPKAAIPDVTRAADLAVAVIEGEVGVRYSLSQNLLFGLDYKSSYFNGLPFEFRPTESTLIDRVELLERDVLFHGLTAGISYSF